MEILLHWNLLKIKAKKKIWKKEIDIFQKLNHPYIVKFYGVGVCLIEEKPTQVLIIEFVNGGDLKSFLIKSFEDDKILSSFKKLEILKYIAEGMSQLHENDVVHRDLAARNILVHIDGEDIIPKITDFGLSRADSENYYILETTNTIPVKWVGPEVLKFKKFYKQSDVYSYGILFWEVFSNGGDVIPGETNQKVLDFMSNENYDNSKPNPLIKKPRSMPEDLFTILQMCIIMDYKLRPSFPSIVLNLTKQLQFTSDQVTASTTLSDDRNLPQSKDNTDYVWLKKNNVK